MVDMGAEPFLLASSMTLTMAQRIVRVLNPGFVEEYKPELAVIEDIKRVLGVYFDAWCKQNNKNPNDVTLFRSSQDRPQTEPEYKGRIGIFEVMPISEELRKHILQNSPAGELEKVAVKEGMLLMKQDGYLKALEGKTTIEEVLRVAEI
jgi:type II secretory ATPase GspE/PulE/Tfp pilus assembly ATPase PilB-like protein